MNILTLYVGQGAFAVVRHAGEALIIDSHIQDSLEETQQAMEKKLALALRNHVVPGLILTGFDSDHCCPAGVELILSKYSPGWVMYPTYYKDTDCAAEVFQIIDRHVQKRKSTARPLKRLSVRVDKVESRILTGLSQNFVYELFSPHIDDMDSSNNSSIVLKVTGVGAGGFSYLITGDTEYARWTRINELFGSSLGSQVLAAPHHGSITGVNAETLLLVQPNTVLISAGVDSQYGHPDPRAVTAYRRVADHVFATNVEGGVSLFTKPAGADFSTELVR